MRIALAAVVVASALAVSSTASAEAQPEQSHAIVDLTGEVLPVLEETYSSEELIGAGNVTIAWLTSTDVYGALVPYVPSQWVECAGATLCVLMRESWWRESGWADQAGANRVMIAHEFGHVLSRQRKQIDHDYAVGVVRVDEECLADAVAAHVLARGGFPPPVTSDYSVAYNCEQFWQDSYGETRQAEADALAADLLVWAATHDDPPPPPAPPAESIDAPATATAGAARLSSSEA